MPLAWLALTHSGFRIRSYPDFQRGGTRRCVPVEVIIKHKLYRDVKVKMHFDQISGQLESKEKVRLCQWYTTLYAVYT
ncbi:hypothetical protein KSX_09090 [Ktedonospora formicarum]|uniref:Uncharacterized protein n=1 Tax=Ktedonospora formicarum TaxID=2778364 RepID=A0A8J3MQG5_9CHLR|nr:hypothetical protein KSX_09090 [Ktedonospora formicarum]